MSWTSGTCLFRRAASRTLVSRPPGHRKQRPPVMVEINSITINGRIWQNEAKLLAVARLDRLHAPTRLQSAAPWAL